MKRRLDRRPVVTDLAVSPAQLIHQTLEIRRGTQRIGAKVPPQPFAHALTDRSAGLAINLLPLVGDSAVHIGFRLVSIEGSTHRTKSSARELFPRHDRL